MKKMQSQQRIPKKTKLKIAQKSKRVIKILWLIKMMLKIVKMNQRVRKMTRIRK